MDNRKRTDNNVANRKPIKNKNYMKLYIIPTVLCILIALIIIVSIVLLKKDPKTTTDDTGASTTEPATTLPAEQIITDTLSATQKQKTIKVGSLVLVNSEYKTDRINVFTSLQSLYPAKSSYQLSSSYLFLTKDAKEAFINMADALYAELGTNELLVSNAFVKAENEAPASKESDKEHDAGLAVDLKVFGSDKNTYPLTSTYATNIYNWLLENAHKYGFVLRYPADKAEITGKSIANQFRYVGVAHATYMKNEGLCLEEYLGLLKAEHNSIEKALKITTASGDTYVYYTDASGDGNLEYKVYKDASVSISGDNQNGIIVTMTRALPQG